MARHLGPGYLLFLWWLAGAREAGRARRVANDARPQEVDAKAVHARAAAGESPRVVKIIASDLWYR